MTLKKYASISLIIAATASALVGCSNNEDNLTSFKGGSITVSEIQKELDLNRILYYSSNKEDMSENQLKEEAEYYAESLSRTEILALEGEKANFSATDEEIKAAKTEFESLIAENADIKSAIEIAGFTDEDITETIKKNLIANKYYDFLIKDVAISESKVEEYYNEHKKTDYTLKYADAAHILIKTIDDEGNSISDKEKAKAKKKAEEVLEKVKAGEDFAELAKEYSEDTTASEGGDLGKFYEGQMVSQFEEAAFALEENETSEIVETMYGYHIIKLNSKGTETLEYDTITSQVAYDLYLSLKEEKLTSLEKKYNLSINNNKIDELLKNKKPINSLIKESSSKDSTKKEDSNNTNENNDSEEATDNKTSESKK